MKFSNLDKAKVQLLGQSPFFATLLLGTPLVETKDIPTAATDGRKIFYNPDFIDSMPVSQIQFVLAHEVGHMMYEHPMRNGDRIHRVFNMAADYAMNQLLVDDGFDMPSSGLIDSKYIGMSAEQIYPLLIKDMEDGKPQPEDGMGNDLMEPGTAAEQAEAKSQMRRMVAQAATAARMAGKFSAGLAKFVDQVLNPVVPWQDLLRDYMTRTNKDDESWRHRNRRFHNVYLPARHSERMGEIVIIVDTSGSIGQKELDQVAAEITSIADTVKPELIRVVYVDTEVAGEETFECGEAIKLTPQGGGGTDMVVGLEHVSKYDPEVVILITDGYTPWPTSEPEYPLIVVCTTDVDVPVGNVVRIN